MAEQSKADGATNIDHETSGACYAEIGMSGRKDTHSCTAGWNTCTLVVNFCVYENGDGVGAIREECVNLVLSRSPEARPTRPETLPTATAEFGMTGPHGSDAWQACMFPSTSGVCKFMMGDGVGGPEEGLSAANNTVACAALVMDQRSEANGAIYSNSGGTGCYAEFGMPN